MSPTLNMVAVLVTVVLSMVVSLVNLQDTHPGGASSTSCQYLDTEDVYTVEILKHREQLPCGTTGQGAADVNEVCKGQQASLLAAMSDMTDLEADISQLLATTGELSDQLLKLEQEFTSVQLALDSPTVGGMYIVALLSQ